MSQRALHRLIARLLPLSRDERGLLSERQVIKVLNALKGKVAPRLLKPLLQHYQRAIQHALHQEQAVMEHAGPVDQEAVDSLTAKLNQQYRRPVQINKYSCPELLAGVRISIADDVYEITLATALQHFLHDRRLP